MTTNIYDKAAKVVAADSRWSIELSDGRLWFVDDTEYDKIHVTNDLVALFAGEAEVINDWKIWLDSDGIAKMRSEACMPRTDGASISLIDRTSGDIAFNRNTSHLVCKDSKYLFSGTGASHAYRCWNTNFCFRKAIETAMTRDLCTGGSVRYFRLDTQAGNIIKSSDLQLIRSALVDRGFIMEADGTGGTKAVLYRDLAANDPDVASLSTQLMSGALKPVAPSHDCNQAWSAEDRTALFTVLARYKH